MTPRRRKNDTGLPSGVQRHGRKFRQRYYEDGKPRWYAFEARTEEAFWREWEALNSAPDATIGAGIRRYMEKVVPELLRSHALPPDTQGKKARKMSPATWRTEERRCEALKAVFGHMLPDEIRIPDLYKFLDEAGDGKKKLKRFSAIWRYFIRWGMTEKDPFLRFDWPADGARDRYVRDDEITEARKIALDVSGKRPGALRVWAWLRLIELTGRRVSDVRTIKLTQFTDEGIEFRESKTGKKTVVEWTAELENAVAEIKCRLHKGTKMLPMYLICDRNGQEVSEGAMDQAMQRLRPFFTEAGIEPFQPRDLRAKYGTDHPDGRTALRHSSGAVFDKHYDRKPVRVKPLK